MFLFFELKGTPPRLDGKTIDFSKLEKKHPDNPPVPFSFINKRVSIDSDKQLFTYMTHTNEAVAKIIKENIHLNRHFNENIQSPRLHFINF